MSLLLLKTITYIVDAESVSKFHYSVLKYTVNDGFKLDRDYIYVVSIEESRVNALF